MTVLIAIEGIDGAGKGTQAELITRRLRDLGYQTDSIQFPRYSATSFGEAIGDFLNGRFGSLEDVHPQLAAVLYAGDRFESLSVLQESMNSNDIVVLDRFTASNFAHQSAKLPKPERVKLINWIDDIEHRVFGLPRPNLNVLLEISSSWSRELVGRKNERDYTSDEADIQEDDQSYLERVRECYRSIAESQPNWCVVECLGDDGDLRAVQAINDDILTCVRPLLSDLLNQTARSH
ncbi:MAG: thymidylate kinase [Fuerstiella sp.]|nr:thymidylate kinase [Fuerstiella sp.]